MNHPIRLLTLTLLSCLAACNGGESSTSNDSSRVGVTLNPANSPFIRIIEQSAAYGPTAAARPDAAFVSDMLTEKTPLTSDRISLGMVFFGQFVDHDITRNLTRPGAQGPSHDPINPINVRSPGLDLDSLYGQGPESTPHFYTADGLFFVLGKDGRNLLRDARGVALIGDDRNDENGLVAQVHLAFQRYHNKLIQDGLGTRSADSLTAEERRELFTSVRRRVTAFFQGIVANQMMAAFTGEKMSRDQAPIPNIPIEFACAAFRLGHTLVPNTIRINSSGVTFSPVDPSLRGGKVPVELAMMFGAAAQPAARMDDQLSDTMHKLLIPMSPHHASAGEFVGGGAPNIGNGHIVNGNLVLDLAETNILRGREQRLPSGEEYLAFIDGRSYDPATDGNTDLFQYILMESIPLGHLGRVGSDILNRTFGGLLAADPNRFYNRELFSAEEIALFENATVEQLLHEIGEPGF